MTIQTLQKKQITFLFPFTLDGESKQHFKEPQSSTCEIKEKQEKLQIHNHVVD